MFICSFSLAGSGSEFTTLFSRGKVAYMYLFCAGPAAVHGALPHVCGHLTEGVLQQEHSQGQAGPGTAHQHHGQAGQHSSHTYIL